MRDTPTEPSGRDTVGRTADTARAEGTEVGRTAAEAGGHVASTAADEARDVAGETRRQAHDLLGEARDRLQHQAHATQQEAAGGVRGLADELRQLSDHGSGGPVTDLAHDAAERAERLAGWLERREPGDLVDQVRTFARHRPGTFLAGAALAGVLAGRLTRGVVDHESEPDPPAADDRGPFPRQDRGQYAAPGLPPDHGAAQRHGAVAPAPTAPWGGPAPADGGGHEHPGSRPGPGYEPPGGPLPSGDGAGVPPPPPAAPPEPAPPREPGPPGPAHAPGPGTTTVGQYVDELDRRGDPRVNEEQQR